jgi:ribosomal protein S18 acetylase RimI-like enzyme
MPSPPFSIQALNEGHHAEAARVMGASDPWLTLGISEEKALRTLQDQPIPGVVAVDADGRLLGFVRYEPRGFINFAGYIRTVAVAAAARGQRVGEALVTHVEDLIFPTTHLVFLFCSTFNTRGHAFYERLGYTRVGTVDGLVVPQHGEVLFVKRRKAP